MDELHWTRRPGKYHLEKTIKCNIPRTERIVGCKVGVDVCG